MADATQDISTHIRNENLAIARTLTVATGSTIYEGTLVGIDTGEAKTISTSKIVAGFAVKKAAAATTVTVWYNVVMKIALSGAAVTDIGTTAYASDNQTATTTPNTAILGPIVDVETGYAWVHLTLRA